MNIFKLFSGAGKTKDEIDNANPNMDVFAELDNDDIDIDDLAVTGNGSGSDQEMRYMNQDYYYNKIYTPIPTNKESRLRTYRLMARYPEVLQCLEDIADDTWMKDDTDRYTSIKFTPTSKNLKSQDRQKILTEEWEKYIALFDINMNGFNYVKQFLVDGELAWENVIDDTNKEKGIVGIKYLPTERYDFLRDVVKDENVGVLFKKIDGACNHLSSNFAQSMTAFHDIDPNSNSASYMSQVLNNDVVPMLWSQMTYINTGDYDYTCSTVYPLIDRSRESYIQLALMHDAAVILRVVRAPERLVFNVDVGNMPDKKAKQHMRSFVNSMNSKKTTNRDGNKQNRYDPHAMLESYYFWKSKEGGGTEVTTLGSSASYGEMEDVEYFLRRLYKSMKVPFSRYQQAENTMERDDTITYEEYAFTRFIIRIQNMFSAGFKNGYITHLKLRGLWEKYELSKYDFEININKPILYELYQQQKLLQIKMENYELVADREEFSTELAMADILGWTQEKIDENRKFNRKELLEESIITYWTDKIEEFGPEGIDSPVPWNEEDEEPEDDEDFE
jgi:hypothetical protein